MLEKLCFSAMRVDTFWKLCYNATKANKFLNKDSRGRVCPVLYCLKGRYLLCRIKRIKNESRDYTCINLRPEINISLMKRS